MADVRIAAALTGLLGAIAWLVVPVLDAGTSSATVHAVEAAGLALLTLAALAAGAGLVSRSATWLRVVVAVCFTLLLGSVLQVLADGLDRHRVEAGTGAVAAVVAVVLLARSRRDRGPSGGGSAQTEHRSASSHRQDRSTRTGSHAR